MLVVPKKNSKGISLMIISMASFAVGDTVCQNFWSLPVASSNHVLSYSWWLDNFCDDRKIQR